MCTKCNMPANFVLSFFLCVCGATLAAGFSVRVINPVNDAPTQAGLVVIAGAYIDGDRYRPLGVAIQKASPHKLWVGLVNMFLYPNITGAVSEAGRLFQKAGMDSSAAMFVAGHQMGGAYLNMLIQEGKIRPTGQILMAAYKWVGLSKHDAAVEQPPTLIVSGDLDGINRITRMSDFFEELLYSVGQNPEAIYTNPVVTLEGVNNGQFASAPLPNTVTDYDIKPEVDNATAHTLIAKYCSSFMVSVLKQPKNRLATARSVLLEAFEDNISRMQPLMKMKKFDEDCGSSSWTKTAQFAVSGLPPCYKDALTIGNTVVPEVIMNQTWPNITKFYDGTIVSTYTTVNRYGVPNFESVSPITTFELQARMKSRDAISRDLSMPSASDPITCKDINMLAFKTALDSSSEIARTRYNTRGRSIQFNNDSVTTDNEQWTFSSLQLGYTNGNATPGLIVTSSSMSTPLDAKPSYTAGMYFCKLLSPLRALEWIYVDSLKPHNT